MRNRLFAAVGVLLAFAGANLLRAAETPASVGTIFIGGRTYNLTRFASYEFGSDEFRTIAVLASDRNLPLAKLQAALAKARDDSDSAITLALDQPYLIVRFSKDGKPQSCQAWANNTSFSVPGSTLKGEANISDGRVAGSISMPEGGEGTLRRKFDIKFDVSLGLGTAAPPKTVAAGTVKPSVSGKFTGNGRPAKLAFVSARRGEPFDDKPTIVLVFTEKDHAKDKNPSSSAVFGRFGSALVITITEEGSVIGCEVAHAAHSKKPFSSLGSMHLNDFELTAGSVQGTLTTDGEQDVFGQKWEVEVKFVAPLSPPAAKTAERPATNRNAPASLAAGKKPTAAPQPAVAALNVHELALPSDITDAEYKALVEQFTFKSPAKVQALAADLTKKLAAQGWTKKDDDLVTQKSAILNRARGKATLTIMLKPAGTGSQVTVFTEGLDWDEKK